jgi:hypothetical protein
MLPQPKPCLATFDVAFRIRTLWNAWKAGIRRCEFAYDGHAFFPAGDLSRRDESRSHIPRGGAPDLFEGQGFDLSHAFTGNGHLTPEFLQARRILTESPRLD